jgi:hypothetical protein
MNQALYAHMNNKIKKIRLGVPYLLKSPLIHTVLINQGSAQGSPSLLGQKQMPFPLNQEPEHWLSVAPTLH